MALLVYKSSAGSGKTYTLVKRFLTLALASKKPNSVSHILALTFTNKAAQEMKGRIVESLHAFSNQTQNPKHLALLNDLINDTKLGLTKEQLIERSKKLLQFILYNYSSFSVSTIDQFNYRLIQTFALDMGLSTTAKVELDELELLQEAIEQLIKNANNDKELSDWLSDFLIVQLNEDKSWNMQNHFFNFSKRILNENDQFEIDQLKELQLNDFNKSLNIIRKSLKNIEKEAATFAEKSHKILSENDITFDQFWYGSTSVGSFFKQLEQCNLIKFPNARGTTILERDDWTKDKTSESSKQAIRSIQEELTNLMRQAIEFGEVNRERWILLQAIEKNIHGLGLLSEIRKLYRLICNERNVIPISDFNKNISNIIKDEPSPYIYERIGNRYKSFLLDEFQDTSKMQWYNLLSLVENGLSTGSESLIVGDAKQAIYRWRGGDADQLTYLPKLVDKNANKITKQQSNLLEQYIKNNTLDNNWRSSKIIVEFNNLFFSKLAEIKKGVIQDVYKNIKQTVKNTTSTGYVNYSVIDTAEQELKSESATPEKSLISDKDEEMHLAVYEKITTLTNAKYQKKDIAILCRSNKQISALSNFLAPKIDIVTSEGLLLFNHSSSQLVLATLKYTLFQKKLSKNEAIIKTNLAVEIFILMHKLKKIKNDLHAYLIAVKEDSSSTNLDLLLQSEGYSFRVEAFQSYNTYQKLLGIVRILGLSKNPSAYLTLLLEKGQEFTQKYPAKSTKQFVDWITLKGEKLSLSLSEDVDAVKIMTIHKSKGLEFPAVIFPFANTTVSVDNKLWVNSSKLGIDLPVGLVNHNKDLLRTSAAEIYERELEKTWLDVINTFYVAMTRPENALFIIAHKYKSKQSLMSIYQPILESYSEFNPKNESLELGKLTPLEQEENKSVDKHESTFIMENLPADDWLENIKISPSILTKNDQISANKYGNIIHLIFKSIHHSSEWETVKNTYNTKYRLTKKTTSRIDKELDALFSKRAFTELFDTKGERFLERDMVGAENEILRPDCVIVGTTKIIILDYKTGLNEDEHKIQLLNYKYAIEQIENLPIEAYLVYTENSEITSVL